LLAAETTRFGTDHFRVGGLILREFQLDRHVVQAIVSLSNLDSSATQNSSSLAKNLRMAQELSDLLMCGDRDPWAGIGERLLQDFQIGTDRLVDMMTRVATELHEWGEQFQLNVPQIDESKFREIAAAALVDLSIEGAIDLSMFQSVFGSRSGGAA